MTTNESITNEQIRTLRREAADAHDEAMRAICSIALGRPWDEIVELIDSDETAIRVRRHIERLGIIPEHVGAEDLARVECARVIADAEAQS